MDKPHRQIYAKQTSFEAYFPLRYTKSMRYQNFVERRNYLRIICKNCHQPFGDHIEDFCPPVFIQVI